MNFQDNLQIRDMREGERYPITQGGNGYSDGVWVTKEGDSLTIQHFWTAHVLDYSNNYHKDQDADVYYPNDPDENFTYTIHKDVMQIIPEAAEYFFENMELLEFYELVFMQANELFMDSDYTAPKHLKGKFTISLPDGTVLDSF